MSLKSSVILESGLCFISLLLQGRLSQFFGNFRLKGHSLSGCLFLYQFDILIAVFSFLILYTVYFLAFHTFARSELEVH